MTESAEGTTDRYLDSGAYAVDALPSEDVAAFEAAMATDPALRSEVDSLRATTARLGLAAAEPAPAGLRDSVMAEVDRTRQDAPVGGGDSVVVPMRRRSPIAVRVLGAAAAVLAVLTLGLSVWVVGLRQDNSALTQAGSQVSRVLTAPDARTVSGAVTGQTGRGAVVVSPSLGEAVFVADDLDAAPSGQTYQLWFVGADGSAVSAGTFEPGADGNAAVPLSGTPGSAAAVGMTLEPAGGSPQPTMQPVLAIPLA
jgi:anti-sigma-K factor RskA